MAWDAYWINAITSAPPVNWILKNIRIFNKMDITAAYLYRISHEHEKQIMIIVISTTIN